MNERENDIRQLLDRFMAGETSLEEEARLGEWFRTHPDVSDDLKEYQMMFGYFDEGMPLGNMEETMEVQGESVERKSAAKSRRLRLPISIAASVALILGLAFSWMFQAQDQPLQLAQSQNQQTASQRKSSALTMPGEQTDTLLQDKLTEHQSDTVKAKPLVPKIKRYRKHLFDPAPPVNLVAQMNDAVADSLISSPGRLADAHLREMEAQQNEMFFKLYLVNALQTQSLNTDVASASFESEENVHDEDHESDDQEVY